MFQRRPRPRPDEKLAGEQAVPSEFVDRTNRQCIVRSRATKTLLDEDVSALQVSLDLAQKPIETLRGYLLVDRTPVDGAFRGLVIDDESVAG